MCKSNFFLLFLKEKALKPCPDCRSRDSAQIRLIESSPNPNLTDLVKTYATRKREAPFCYFLKSFRVAPRRLSASLCVLPRRPASSLRVSIGPSASLCIVFPRLSGFFRVVLRSLSASLCVLPRRSASFFLVSLCPSASLGVVFPPLSVSFRVALRCLSASLWVLPRRSASSFRVSLGPSASLCVLSPRL